MTNAYGLRLKKDDFGFVWQSSLDAHYFIVLSPCTIEASTRKGVAQSYSLIYTSGASHTPGAGRGSKTFNAGQARSAPDLEKKR